jgi:mRNA interferase HicA
VPQRGKGSHGTLYYGDQFTVVGSMKKELKGGTTRAMLKQLGIKSWDF